MNVGMADGLRSSNTEIYLNNMVLCCLRYCQMPKVTCSAGWRLKKGARQIEENVDRHKVSNYSITSTNLEPTNWQIVKLIMLNFMSVQCYVLNNQVTGVEQLMVAHGEGSDTPNCIYYSDLCPWPRWKSHWKFELVKGQAQLMKCISLLLG